MTELIQLYIGSTRVCDYYNCHDRNISEYYNDLRISLKFCDKHTKRPYDTSSDIVPIFKKENYKIYDANKNKLCEHVGCNKSVGQIPVHNGYWCVDHGRIVTSLRANCLNKSDKTKSFLNKFKEFTFRKTLNVKLYEELLSLEKELGLDTRYYMNLNTTLIHYHYCNFSNKEEKIKEESFSLFDKSNEAYFDDLFKFSNKYSQKTIKLI